MMLKRYREELYASIYLSRLRPSITSQIWGSLLSSDCVPSLTTIFSTVLRIMIGTPSSPLFYAPRYTTPPLSMAISAPRARNDGILPALVAVVLLVGATTTLSRHVPVVARKIILPKNVGSNLTSLLLPKQFVTTSASFSPASPDTPTPHYHVTLMSVEYNELCSWSTDVSSLASLASLHVKYICSPCFLFTIMDY